MKRVAFAFSLFMLSSFSAAWAQTQRVQFPAGQTTAVIKGRVNPLSSKGYLVRVRAGQQLKVHFALSPSKKWLRFSISDSQYSARTLPGAADVTDWEGEIKETKDYLIGVFVVRDAPEVSFTLEVTIPAEADESSEETPTAPTNSSCKNFSGTYNTNYGPLKFTRTGNNVRGAYTTEAGAKGTLTGTLQGTELVGTWREPGSTGRLKFKLGTDGYSFTGSYRVNGEPDGGGEWNGQCPD